VFSKKYTPFLNIPCHTENHYVAVTQDRWIAFLEPILRLFNLQLQRQRCNRLERFSKKKKRFFDFKTD
jgi:hypothetical protein